MRELDIKFSHAYHEYKPRSVRLWRYLLKHLAGRYLGAYFSSRHAEKAAERQRENISMGRLPSTHTLRDSSFEVEGGHFLNLGHRNE